MRMQLDIPAYWQARGPIGDCSRYAVDRGDIVVEQAAPVGERWRDFCAARASAALPPGWTASVARTEEGLTEKGWPIELVWSRVVDATGRRRGERLTVVFRFGSHGAAVSVSAPDGDSLGRIVERVLGDVLEASSSPSR